MSSSAIREYARPELRWIDAECLRVIALTHRLSIVPPAELRTKDIQPILEGIEGMIEQFQHVYDRCAEQFLTAAAPENLDPFVADLQGLIQKYHLLWEGWNMPLP